MPKFKCKNPDCLFYDKEYVEPKITILIIDGKPKARERFCPHCNQERESLPEVTTYMPPTYEAVGIGSNRRNWSKITKESKPIY